MKLLLLSDIEQDRYWQPTPEMFEDIDLILSAGDLKPEYLNRLAAAALASRRRTYLLYVHGNHDGLYAKALSRSCVCVDGDLLELKGLRILGLGGSPRYNAGPHQYSEEEMLRRADDLEPKLRRSGGVDILLTHVPPRGVGDEDDRVHRGFACFHTLIERLEPSYLVHGHVHLHGGDERVRMLGRCTVVNACGSYLLEI